MFEIQRQKRLQFCLCKTLENKGLAPILEECNIKEKISIFLTYNSEHSIKIALRTPDIRAPPWGDQQFSRIREGSGGALRQGQGMAMAA